MQVEVMEQSEDRRKKKEWVREEMLEESGS